MHIATVRRNGVVDGYQLRAGSGGQGQTKFFSVKKHGGEAKAIRAAERVARELGMPQPTARGGSITGRILKTSATRAAGIRFVWVRGVAAPVLRVVATWIDKSGRARNTSYSCERNGLEGALDKAIAARTSAGALKPNRDVLLRKLRTVHRSGALD